MDIVEESIQLGNDTELLENDEEERNILFDFTDELFLEPQ